MAEYEAWRPALIAFYRADAWFQSAENLEKYNYPLGPQDIRLIKALQVALEHAPEPLRKAA